MAEKYKVAKNARKEAFVRGPTGTNEFDRFGTYSVFEKPCDAEKAAELCNLAYDEGMEAARRSVRGALGL